MNQQEQQIRDALVTSIIEEWQSNGNPFDDIVWPEHHVDDVASQFGQNVDTNDVKYVLQLTLEDYYFPKRGKSRRISQRAVAHALDRGVDLPLKDKVQEEILEILKASERKNVNHPEVSHDDMKSQLNYSDKEVDFNLFYCQLQGWVDVETYIESNNWSHAVITSSGRNRV